MMRTGDFILHQNLLILHTDSIQYHHCYSHLSSHEM